MAHASQVIFSCWLLMLQNFFFQKRFYMSKSIQISDFSRAIVAFLCRGVLPEFTAECTRLKDRLLVTLCPDTPRNARG